MEGVAAAGRRRARRWHRLTAVPVGAFVLAHLANHLAALAGAEAHVGLMDALRAVYRAPLVEGVLFAALAAHGLSGLRLLRVRTGPWGARRISGACLLLFLPVHVAGVLVARHVFGLETDFRFAASGLHTDGVRAFFGAYCLIAVVALTTHLGCALARRLPGVRHRSARRLVVGLATTAGIVAGVAVVAALSGAFYPVTVPSAYRVLYGR